MNEPFDIKKALDFSPLQWFKSVKLGVMIALVVLIGLTIWRAYFMPTKTTHIIAQPGSNVTIHEADKRKPWWKPTLFTDIYAFTEKTSDTWRNGLGARGGLRWEF